MLAKRYRDGKDETVAEHMRYAATIAGEQYDKLPQGVKNLLPSRQLCVFVVAAHDLGKASPVFQLHIKENKGRNKPQHWIISYKILRDKGLSKSICEITAAHHGTPPNNYILNNLNRGSYDLECGFNMHYSYPNLILQSTKQS